MRLFLVALDDRRQPNLLKGETERAVLHNAELLFEGFVGGVEGYLNGKYTDGYAMLTNYRLLWISYRSPDTPFDGVPCHVPLAAISETELSHTFLQLKPSRVKLHVRLDASGYPSSDALTVERVVKIKISSNQSNKTDSWYSALQDVVQRKAWKAAPPGLLQEMHTPPPTGSIFHTQRPSSGPMTPPPSLLQGASASNIGGGGTWGDVDPGMVAQLQQLGYSEAQAVDALRATHNAGVEQAANWLLDGPRTAPSPAAAGFTPPSTGGPLGAVLSTPDSSGGSTVFNYLLQQGRAQQQQQPTPHWPPQHSSHPAAANTAAGAPSLEHTSLGDVGIGGVLRRQERRAAETDRILGEAFTDLNQLMVKAEAMVKLAEEFRVRSARTRQGASNSEIEDQMDDALAAELAELGIASPVTRETCGRLYYSELARQVAAVMEVPVAEAGGVLPLPEVYRRFCRARFQDLVSPDDLLQAVKKLPEIGATVKLKEFPSGVKALVSVGMDEEALQKKIIELAEHGELIGENAKNKKMEGRVAVKAGSSGVLLDGENGGIKMMPWVEKLGPGVLKGDVAAALGIALPLAAEHLSAAEAAGMLCRDDGPEGVRWYKNFFKEVATYQF